MNLVYGEVTDLFIENGMQMGLVRVSGALKKVPLDLLTSIQRGDTVLVCDGVAISKATDTIADKIRHVSGDSR
jgi:hydrogenase maturation factor